MTSTTLAAPNVVSRGALRIFGLKRRYRGSNAGMAAQWAEAGPVLAHVAHRIGGATYGAIVGAGEPDTIDYITGVEVSEFPDEPAAFSRVEIPAQTYAVFWHAGHVSTAQQTWQAIWDHGLADASLRKTQGPAFERYRERFDPKTGEGGFEIWVPVEA